MKLTILNVGQNYHIAGGSDRYQFALTDLLQKRGHEVIPFAARSEKNLPTGWGRYFPAGADFNRPMPADLLRYIYSPQARKAASLLLEDNHVDLAHLHIYYGKLTSSILAPLRQKGVPIVQTLHEYKTVCPVYTLVSRGKICEACRGSRYWHAVLRRCNRGSIARSALSAAESCVSRALGSVDKIDHFIAVSGFVRKKVIQLGLPPERVTTVHNFMDVSGIKPDSRPGSYFLYFGRIEEIKGVFTLIEAASALKKTDLLIAGNGGALGRLRELIRDRGLSHVKLLGFRQGAELHNLIRGAICTITPSEWYETFGLTLLESFAHGRPVIASRIGGMEEIVTDGEDGFLFSPGDAGGLRDRLAWMDEHRQTAVEMGERGRRKVETKFNEEVHYKQLLDVYTKAFSRAR
jgi:glycosyltransferase involved in cell wall biosynthesis